MRLIDADALNERVDESRRDNPHKDPKIRVNHTNEHGHFLDMIIEAPTIDAEPVRHEGNTTFVSTNSLESYADRIIVGQGTLCKVYYRDEPVRHGRWYQKRISVPKGKGQTYLVWACSLCHKHEKKRSDYCPNCGAKMRGDTDG